MVLVLVEKLTLDTDFEIEVRLYVLFLIDSRTLLRQSPSEFIVTNFTNIERSVYMN